MRDDSAPARFLWLPPGLRPPVAMVWRQERVFLLVGAAALFAGYDLNVYGLAIPQIQASFQIPEDQVALIVAYFRMAAFVAMLICASADLVGRRRLLLFTILGQAIATLATSFAGNANQFLWAQFCTRAFGYAEEMLCFVVIAEEVAAASRGWASGALSAMNYTGAGIASLIFAAVNFLPYGWRAIYVIGALPLFLVAYLRRRLPETERFAVQEGLASTPSKFAETLGLLRDLARQYPGRIAAILAAVAAYRRFRRQGLQDWYQDCRFLGEAARVQFYWGLAGLPRSVADARLALAAMSGMVADLEPVPAAMQAAAGRGYSTATDLADWLVRTLKLPFREAHHVTGAIVKAAETIGVDLPDLPLSAMQNIEPRITKDVFSVLSVADSVKSRTSYGGTAPQNVAKMAALWLERLEKDQPAG